MKTPLIYIAGPISRGDMLANVRQFDAAFVELVKLGFAPFNPGLSVFLGSAQRPVEPDGPVVASAEAQAGGLKHEDWMRVDLAWLNHAHAVLRLPGESVGADEEVTFALRKGVPVYHSIKDLWNNQHEWKKEPCES